MSSEQIRKHLIETKETKENILVDLIHAEFSEMFSGSAVLRLDVEYFQRVVHYNMNHLEKEVSQKTLDSFVKHCIKYLLNVANNSDRLRVLDKHTFGFVVEKLGMSLAFTSETNNIKRDLKPDGNIIVLCFTALLLMGIFVLVGMIICTSFQ